MLFRSVTENAVINKETLNFNALKAYKINLLEKVFSDFKINNISLVEETESVSFYEPKKKEKKETKKPTSQTTYELWVEKNSIEQIAEIRKLTVGTIMGHFIKLIQDKAVTINDIMPEDKLALLAKAFENYTEESLNPLKEQVGDSFSWDELKLYKASLV